MKEKKTVDRRVLKTKRAIRNAFAALMAEKELNDITVREIAELADINRKTFYNYYTGVHEVVDEIENEVVSSVEAVLEGFDWVHAMEDSHAILSRVTDVINTDIEFYRHLFTMHGNNSLSAKIVALLKEKIRSAMGEVLSEGEALADTTLVFLLNGMLSAYQNWFLSNRGQTLEKLTDCISALCFQGLSGVLEL